MQDKTYPLNLIGGEPAWSIFDSSYYGRHDAEAAQAARGGPEAALQDYEERGARLGYGPNVLFDPTFYLASNPEAAEQVASGQFSSAYEHFAVVGWLDTSPHWLFDATQYGRLYPDLTPEAIEGCGGLYSHYLSHGVHEGRIGHKLFDAGFYVRHLPESERAAAAGNPFIHYLTHAQGGPTEARCTPYFSPGWYRATYQDVAEQIAVGNHLSALQHYIVNGSAEGRDPLCDFSEQDYRAAYPDVDLAIRNGVFRCGYDHFISFGVFDPRSPTRTIDLMYYSRLPAVTRDMESGTFANVFLHLLEVGLKTGLPLTPPVPSAFAVAEEQARPAFIARAQRDVFAYGRAPLDFELGDGAPAVSVIVILRNHFALTMQALNSLRSTYQGGIELIIVDNGSIDETRNIGDVVKGARIIRLETNIGFLRGCNLALEHATAPAVLYLNNDLILHPGAVTFALRRLESDTSIGAVGGKIIRSHGMLQEAGCIVWRDGSCEGWMRDASPDAPEANFVRDVDFCSGCFLLVRADLLKRLGGFDDAFAPAYYEETDLCLRIQAAGYRVVYDPAVSLTHLEYASARSVRAATDQMVTNSAILRNRHAVALRRRPIDRTSKADAAAFASRGRRVLFIEDTIPIPRLGSGYGRAADILTAIVAAGWQATVFPMVPVETPLYWLTAALPETAELLWNRNITTLSSFLMERRGYYDMIWVSRAHNLRQLAEIVSVSPGVLGHARIVLDTEAVFSVRDAARASLVGLPFDLTTALKRELENIWLCDHVVAVSEAEAAIIRDTTSASVSVVCVRQQRKPIETSYGERAGILHVGTLISETSPNYDGLQWYVSEVMPILRQLMGDAAPHLSVAGTLSPAIDLSWLRAEENVTLLGPVSDLTPLFGSHRVFIAPTRFAAGIPVKVLEAAGHGMPVVCTELIARQLGWHDGTEARSAASSDPAAFARAIADLYTDETLWRSVRSGALEAVEQGASPERFTTQLRRVLEPAA